MIPIGFKLVGNPLLLVCTGVCAEMTGEATSKSLLADKGDACGVDISPEGSDIDGRGVIFGEAAMIISFSTMYCSF